MSNPTWNELMIADQELVDKARKCSTYEAGMMLLCWVKENASDDPSWRNSPVWDAIVSIVETGCP
jgi:hypothetical protein